MATSIGIKGGTSQGGGGGTIAVTLAGITAGSTIAAGVLFAHTAAETITGVSDAQGSYAQVAAQKNDTVATVAVQCWYLKNANSGSHTITASFSGGANGENYIYAIEVKGADTTAPLGTVDSGTANTGTALATGATLSGSTGDAILAFGGNESTAETYTKGATFDAITTQGQMFGETRILTGSVSSFAANATQSASADWVIQGFTIVAASGGGGFTAKFRKTLSPLGTGVGKRQSQ